MKKNRKIIGMIVAAAAIVAGIATYASQQGSQSKNDEFIHIGRSAGIETDFTRAAESTVNSVVSVKSYATPRVQQMQNFIDPFEFFFGPGNGFGQQQPRQRQQPNQKPQQSGLGSGVIITSDGYIVTNNHVIEGAEKLEVTLNDNRTFNAKVIGSDSKTDLALLKIEATGLKAIEIGNSDDVKVGEWVLAVGNPFGFTSSVTAGIISAKARSISSATHSAPAGLESFIQTDAAVNPGNSGGALVNVRGQLIGINTMIYSSTGNYAGTAFAIPSVLMQKVVTDLKEYGTVQRAVLGIQYQELTSELAEEKGIKGLNDGIYVAKVEDRSAAKEAGLEEGDVITAIDGAPVKNSGLMMEQMNKLRPGDKVTVTYVRDGKSHNTTVTMRNTQGSTDITKSRDLLDLGCAFRELKPERLKELQISKGIEVTGIKDGRFKEAGIKDGFIILDINNSPVSTRDDVEAIYRAIMNDSQSDKVMFITGIYPTGKKVYYAVDLAD